MTSRDIVEGAVFGMAFGDAWGYTVEFLSYDQIIRAQPQPPDLLVISDDTQMSIANAYALQDLLASDLGGGSSLDLDNHDAIRRVFAERHLAYHHDPDNTRAPGITVSGSLADYDRSARITGMEGLRGNTSKGCGTVMRAPWLGLAPQPRETIATLAVLQAQTTHGHPVAWLAAAVAALVMQDIVHGEFSRAPGPFLINNALAALDLVERLSAFTMPADDYLDMRTRLREVHTRWDVFASFRGDPTEFFGAGWTADEAVVVALAVASRFIDDPHEAIRRLVYTDGDSDSIAAIGGALVGAANGHSALGVDVKSHLEPRYQRELAAVCDILYCP